MNLINWPALSVWAFIAQLVAHCSGNAEVTGSNQVEAPEKLFLGYFTIASIAISTVMVTYSFHTCMYKCAPQTKCWG